jgi:hypothetical protein
MKVSPQAYAIFDFEGRVTVRVTLKSKSIANLEGLVIRPLAAGIRPRVKGKILEFELDRPGEVTIDPLGTGLRVLHIFANAPEQDVPRKGDPGVVYFGPGVHDVEDLELKAGQTLYLAGGAVLRPLPKKLRKPGKHRHYTGREYSLAVAAIRARGDNVTVRGRGVISGERGLAAGRRFGLFRGSRTKNLRMRGVVFTRSSGWTLLLHDCRGGLVDGVRVLGYFTNSDGICLHSCRDFKVRNCFVHTADDCYEVKARAENVVFEKSQVWCDAGAAMGVTHEINGTVENVTWRDITVLHYTYRFNPHEGITSRGAIFVHPAMGGTVRKLLFEDITVEGTSTKRPLVIVYNVKRPRRGVHFFPEKPHSRISDVIFRKLRARNVRNPEMLIVDETRKGLIGGIRFEDVVLNGKPLEPGDRRLRRKGVDAGAVSVPERKRGSGSSSQGESAAPAGLKMYESISDRTALVIDGDERFAAAAVLGGAPYECDRTGERDASAVIQKALDDTGKRNGGTVFLPAGRYRVERPLEFRHPNVVLRGEWTSPQQAELGKGTVLLALPGKSLWDGGSRARIREVNVYPGDERQVSRE